MVRDKIGAVAAFKKCVVVDRLPKTRSGKILRGTMQAIADCKEYKMPATIDDPGILPEIDERIAVHRVFFSSLSPHDAQEMKTGCFGSPFFCEGWKITLTFLSFLI